MSESAKWYVIHTYSGYENKVATSIRNAVENRKLEDKICEVCIPTETVTELKEKNGVTTRVEVEHKLFPGYVLLKMVMNDETWYIVRNIRGVTGFVGPESKPVPLTDEEVAKLGVESRKIEVDFSVGDSVSIASGYFAGFIGTVTNIDLDKGLVNLTVSMMGRDTSVDVPIEQVAVLA